MHEIVKAFVSLRPGVTADDALKRDVLAFARRRLGAGRGAEGDRVHGRPAAHAQRQILRRMLRAGELGEPLGDTSTLEAGA